MEEISHMSAPVQENANGDRCIICIFCAVWDGTSLIVGLLMV